MEHKEFEGFGGGGEAPEEEAMVVGGRGVGVVGVRLLPLEVGVEALLEGVEKVGDGVGCGPGVRDAGQDPVAEAGELLFLFVGGGWWVGK